MSNADKPQSKPQGKPDEAKTYEDVSPGQRDISDVEFSETPDVEASGGEQVAEFRAREEVSRGQADKEA